MQRKPWPMARSWIVVGCLIALAACGAPIDERARVAGVLKDAPPPPSSVVVREANAAPRTLIVTPPGPMVMTPPAPRPTETAPPPRRVARTAPPPPAPTEEAPPADVKTVVPLFEAARLVGLGRSELADLMGTPKILRHEPPGEVWLYKSDACVAHIYLYEEAGPDDYQVSYVETRSEGAPVSSAQCLAHLASGSASTVSLNQSRN